MPYSGFDLDKGVAAPAAAGREVLHGVLRPGRSTAADRHPDLTAGRRVAAVEGLRGRRPRARRAAGQRAGRARGHVRTRTRRGRRDAVAWYTDPRRARRRCSRPTGPTAWQRVERGEAPERRPLPDDRRSRNIDEDDLSISFDVDRVGEPVLVKTSYFPNWKVVGRRRPLPGHAQPDGRGPHRRSTCELTYGNTPVEYLGYGLTGVGLVGLGSSPGAARSRSRPPPRTPPRTAATRDGADGDRRPARHPPTASRRRARPEPVGFWDSLLAERKAELAEADERAEDPPGDGDRAGRRSSTRTGTSATTSPARSARSTSSVSNRSVPSWHRSASGATRRPVERLHAVRVRRLAGRTPPRSSVANTAGDEAAGQRPGRPRRPRRAWCRRRSPAAVADAARRPGRGTRGRSSRRRSSRRRRRWRVEQAAAQRQAVVRRRVAQGARPRGARRPAGRPSAAVPSVEPFSTIEDLERRRRGSRRPVDERRRRWSRGSPPRCGRGAPRRGRRPSGSGVSRHGSARDRGYE